MNIQICIYIGYSPLYFSVIIFTREYQRGIEESNVKEKITSTKIWQEEKKSIIKYNYLYHLYIWND